MKAKEFEDYMRAHQFDDLCVPEGTFIALHIDGDNFHKLRDYFEHPYDEGLRERLVDIAKVLMKEFNAIIGYVQSDEINLILPREFTTHKRNVAKIISKATSIATAVFNASTFPFIDTLALFATHVYLLPKWEQVQDYINWRKSDCQKNALNSALYWELRDIGYSPKQATRKMDKMGHNMKLGYLEHTLGKDFYETSYYFREGHMLFWKPYNKIYLDENGDEQVAARRTIHTSEFEWDWKDRMLDLMQEHGV